MTDDIMNTQDGIEEEFETTAEDTAAGSSADGRLDNARQRFAQVASGVEQKVGKLKDGAGSAKSKVREGAEKVGTVTKERYDSTVENVRQGYGKVSKDFEHLTEDVNEYVRDNPGRSVLMAAGVGFLVGMLMRGGRR